MDDTRSKSRSLDKGIISPSISAWAGIIGPIVFVVVFAVFEQITPGYSPITQVISNLELVQNGWIQQLNFLQCGSLIIVFAIGFRKGMLKAIDKNLRHATTLLVFSGAGMIDASFFTPASPVEHALGFLFFIVPLTTAFFLIGRDLLKTGSWCKLGSYSIATGLVTLALLLYFFSLGASNSFGFIGIVNRLFVIGALAWFVVISTRLLRSES